MNGTLVLLLNRFFWAIDSEILSHFSKLLFSIWKKTKTLDQILGPSRSPFICILCFSRRLGKKATIHLASWAGESLSLSLSESVHAYVIFFLIFALSSLLENKIYLHLSYSHVTVFKIIQTYPSGALYVFLSVHLSEPDFVHLGVNFRNILFIFVAFSTSLEIYSLTMERFAYMPSFKYMNTISTEISEPIEVFGAT